MILPFLSSGEERIVRIVRLCCPLTFTNFPLVDTVNLISQHLMAHNVSVEFLVTKLKERILGCIQMKGYSSHGATVETGSYRHS